MNPAIPSPRIAFFGGSFDPPHLGHLAVAHAALTALELDTVFFAPVGAQPLKPHGSTASFADRVAMMRLAIESEPRFELSLADSPRPGPHDGDQPNYTIDTLELVRTAIAPDASLFFLMGADSFLGLSKWHRAAEIPFAAQLVVASRPGQPLDQLQATLPTGLTIQPVSSEKKNGIDLSTFTIADAAGRRAPFYLLPDLDVEISASAIREQIGAAGQNAALLSAPVAEYIRTHHLYL